MIVKNEYPKARWFHYSINGVAKKIYLQAHTEIEISELTETDKIKLSSCDRTKTDIIKNTTKRIVVEHNVISDADYSFLGHGIDEKDGGGKGGDKIEVPVDGRYVVENYANIAQSIKGQPKVYVLQFTLSGSKYGDVHNLFLNGFEIYNESDELLYTFETTSESIYDTGNTLVTSPSNSSLVISLGLTIKIKPLV